MELNRLLNKGTQNIEKGNRRMLDLGVTDTELMSSTEIKYTIFELEAAEWEVEIESRE